MGTSFVRTCCTFILIVAVAWLPAMEAQGLLDDEPAPGLDLTVVPLDQLVTQLDLIPRNHIGSLRQGESRYEFILSEFVRRGGPEAEQVLSKHLAAMDQRKKAARDAILSLPEGSIDAYEQISNLERSNQDLQIVTALRRIKKQPDPLTVVIELPKEIKAWTRELPVFKVAIRNVDADKRNIWFQEGGDYRSGRHERWRIHVWDSEDNLLPELPRPSSFGGGSLRYSPLEFGETWDVTLPMESYVRIWKPGKYKLQVLYHDSKTIADFHGPKDLEGLIVYHSEIIDFNVEHGPMIPIRLKPASTLQAKSLISLLDPNTPLKILVGEYDKEAYSFINPESPEGQLLAMQWQAVPALVASLEDERLSFRKRAWILALLFSITLERDLNPMNSDSEIAPRGIVKDYEYRGSVVTSVFWKSGASYGIAGEGKVYGGEENLKEQLAFAQKWLQFREEYLDIQPEE